MTALLAPKRPSQRRTARQRLREVQLPQRRMAGLPFILSLGALLVLGMVGLLLLNTQLQEQAFAVRDQQKAATQLGYQVAALETEVTEARSSARLAIAASELGMVPNPYPVYLQLPSGEVIGNPTELTGYEIPDVRYRTPEQLAALAKASEEALARKQAAEAERKAEEAARKKAEAEQEAAEAARKQAEAAKQKQVEAAKKKTEAAKKKTEANR